MPANYPAAPVRGETGGLGRDAPQVFGRDVVDDSNAHRHDSGKLAAAISALYDNRMIHRRPTAVDRRPTFRTA